VPLLSPWSLTGDGSAWDRITVGGVTFPAAVAIDGDLWKPKNDHRHGRGTRGGRSVSAGWELAEFSVRFAAFDEETDTALSAVVDVLARRAPQTEAVSVDHPALAAAGITQVTFNGASAPKPDGPGGFLVWEVKLKEFRDPTPHPARAIAPAEQAPEEPRFGAQLEHPPFGANRRVVLPTGDP
jgi:hypothetical protein